jgi:putative FmdB family regulatory protein
MSKGVDMIYDYRCKACDNVQEEMHKHTELNTFKFTCAVCGFDDGERLLSAPKYVGIGSIDSTVFLGGNLTKFDTLNGKPRKKKVISNQYRNNTPE